MRIAFDRFVALTAALAGVGGSLSACGSDAVDPQANSGGSVSAGAFGEGGNAGSAVGRGGSAGSSPSGGATNTGGTGEAGMDGDAGNAGETGEGGSAGSTNAVAGAGAGGEAATAGTDAAGAAGNSGTAGAGGSSHGEAGQGGAGGEGGTPGEECLGDSGITSCSELGLPSDECNYDPNPLKRACEASTGGLRPGVLQGLGNCLLAIPDDSCSSEAADETYACEEDAARRACPTEEAHDACASGVALEGGGSFASPLVVCDDGTLTQESCTELLNAVKISALPSIVACADPAGEYGGEFSGTCAERLHHCVFPHSWFYPW